MRGVGVPESLLANLRMRRRRVNCPLIHPAAEKKSSRKPVFTGAKPYASGPGESDSTNSISMRWFHKLWGGECIFRGGVRSVA